MAKEAYEGLDIVFVPVEPEDVISTSGSCPPVSTQYYVTAGLGECDSDEPGESSEVGYSYNYYRVPEGAPV